MALARILFVDDDEAIRRSLSAVLERHGFEVACAAGVGEALSHISTGKYDLLLSDLYMPSAGDGFAVVSAMRQANPNAVTLVLSGFPEMPAATNPILMQIDEFLTKPMRVPELIDVITQTLAQRALHKRRIKAAATILEQSTETRIDVLPVS